MDNKTSIYLTKINNKNNGKFCIVELWTGMKCAKLSHDESEDNSALPDKLRVLADILESQINCMKS